MLGGTSAAAVDCSHIFDANGDGLADLPIGTPAEDVGAVANSGAVTVLLGNASGGFTGAGSRQIVQQQVGQVSEAGDRFGASIATLDWNVFEDACVDLAVGIPGEDGGVGRVVVILGSPTGLDLSRRIVLRQGVGGTPDAGESGDRFGEAMTASGAGVEGTANTLVVGVPGEDIGTVVDAGVVDVFRFDPSLGRFSTAGTVVRQGAGSVPDTAERGDGFGSSLGAIFHGFATAMVIGVPGEDINGVQDAGMVHEFNGAMTTHEIALHQNSTSIPDTNEAGDRFGAAVGSAPFPCRHAAFAPGVVVGAPGEDIGGLSDVGAVTMFEPGNPADAGNQLRQGAAGIPGTPQAGDRFGSSIAETSREIAVGVPGQDAGEVADAGSVTLIRSSCAGTDPFEPRDLVVESAREFSQNSIGVPDTAENGDRLGTRLAVARSTAPGVNEPTLVATAPGESVGTVAGAGIVHTFRVNSTTNLVQIGSSQWFTQNSAGVPDSAEPGDGFGAVLQ
jgi:hypothetical protein